MTYIDTHAHIVKSYLKDKTLDEILKLSEINNVTHILIPGTTAKDSFEALEMQKENKNIFAGFGIHPADVAKHNIDLFDKNDFSNFKFIGESGIDLYHEENPPLEEQIKFFRKHLELAKKLNLPIEIHTREAFEETYNIMKEEQYIGIKFIMHSFTGNLEWAKKFISIGAHISFSGIVTFKNAKEVQESAKNISLNKILIETDTPFLSPIPFRGKTNNPSNVKYVGDFIANLRDEENEKVLNQIYSNTKILFNID